MNAVLRKKTSFLMKIEADSDHITCPNCQQELGPIKNHLVQTFAELCGEKRCWHCNFPTDSNLIVLECFPAEDGKLNHFAYPICPSCVDLEFC